ncbi:MAG: NAD(P)/FAD-dependent oxidoreductase [Clostridiales bacterium]|nr:NAD(P)/FAD-dependent oxidoreductase [Clostridiales bacterium]
MRPYDVIVIGAGPAGMTAAAAAAEQAARVLILERNEKAGRKLAITGKGRCNLTNTADERTTQEQMVSNPKFILSALHRYSHTDVMERIEGLGVPLKVERGGRVFPQSDRAFDIVDALVKDCRIHGVRMLFEQTVTGIRITEQGFLAQTAKESYEGRTVILATGGITYPSTGSTGFGYEAARALGHSTVPSFGGLVPLVTKESWPGTLMGLSLRNVGVKVTQKGKTLFTDFGEMLFTHFGISGPVVLSASSRLRPYLRKQGVETYGKAVPMLFHIDLKPALDPETLERRIMRDLEKYAKKQLIHAMEDLLPKSLIPVVLQQAGLDEQMRADQLSKAKIRALAAALKDLPLTIQDTRPVTEAIITQGGISVKEIDPKTMGSKIVPGLFFAGEVIDVDALTGGFNLQIAFSTGRAAGSGACAFLQTAGLDQENNIQEDQ